ncbi:hypothetical protein F5984_08765 [Rudanella paleaurantiibacter]|uniref:Uncharacterized protein n=1 Tax=Rudanella paleaurantiibacter TaxID=2614655 RepID=A0A7J5TZS2_9BACT|nr:hypothetical protein [Rudanella paleaurantiibacter]KAB7730917.1 hypothetical protein F5984_08765 [Rudanella paleaurantiibacter]
MFTSIQQKINKQLTRLYTKKGGAYPDYELLYDLVCDSKESPSWEKTKYLTKLYWALKDLSSEVYSDQSSIKSIDEANQTVTYTTQRFYNDKCGIETLPDRTVTIAPYKFVGLYSGKLKELIEREPVVTSHTKLDHYLSLPPFVSQFALEFKPPVGTRQVS